MCFVKVNAVVSLYLTIFNSIFDSPQTITDGILDLSDGMGVGSLDQDGHRQGVLALLHKRVFALTLNNLKDTNMRLSS